MEQIPILDVDKKQTLTVSSDLYSLKSIESASYKYSGFASFNILPNSESYEIEIESLPNSELNVQDVYHLLKNELINESLREKIAKDTEVERNLILSYVFSNTPLVN